MSQDIFPDINPSSTSGNQLAALLNAFKAALMSGLSGTSRPSALLAGGMWVDTTRNALGFWDLKIYTGTQDVVLFAVNLNTGSVSITATENQLDIVMRTDDSYGPVLNLLKKRIANGGQTLSGDTLGELQWSGLTDGSLAELQASIKVLATENVTATAQGSEMIFSTTQKGSTNLVNRMRITDEGKVGIGMVPTVEFEVSGAIKGTNVYGGNGTFTGTVSGVNGTFTGTVGILNLNVTGVFNAAETHLGSITEITDPNFILNKGGNQADANANVAGFTVEMTDATHFKMGYDSTKASKVVAGEVGSLKELLNVDSAQQAKNKSLETPQRLDAKIDTKANLVTYAALVGSTSGQLCYASDEKRYYGLIDNLLAPLGVRGGQATDSNKFVLSYGTTTELLALTREAGSMYYDTTQQKLVLDNGTDLIPAGSGGVGSSSTYHYLNSEDDLTTWYTGNNATFMGGGAIAGTFTKKNETNPLNGKSSYTYVQAAGSLNDYVCSYEKAVPLRSRGKEHGITFPFMYDGADNDIKIIVRGYNGTTWSTLSSDLDLVKKQETISGKVLISIYAPSDCVQIRVGFQVLVLNSGKTLKWDDVEFSDDPLKYKNMMSNQTWRVNTTGSVKHIVKASSYTNVFYFDSASMSAIDENSGDQIFEITNSSTTGWKAKANRKAFVSLTLCWAGGSGAGYIGFSKNGTPTELSNPITSLPTAKILGLGYNLSAQNPIAHFSGWVQAGDEIFIHGNATNNTLSGYDYFSFSAMSETDAVVTPIRQPVQKDISSFLGGDVTSVVRAIAVYYRTGDGAHRLKIEASGGINDLRVERSISVSGVIFKNVASFLQPLSLSLAGTAPYTLFCNTLPNTGTIIAKTASSGTSFNISGDVELESKPTWADDVSSQYMAVVPIQRTCHIKDIRTTGTNGGTSASGHQVRNLNTLSGDTSFITLASNQITITSPGEYLVKAKSPCFRGNQHQAYLRDISQGVNVPTLTGSTEYADLGGSGMSSSFISGTIIVTTPRTFELKHYISNAVSNLGLGLPSSSGNSEIYSELEITKVR